MVLIAIVLIGALTGAILRGGGGEGAQIDNETLAVRASEVQRHASEIARAVLFITGSQGKSESDIRFAHPQAHADYGDLAADTDKTDQVFHKDGGGANYKLPPDGVNDGSAWEFYGGTALPAVGSDKADLVAVLPNVTLAFCNKINALNGQPSTPPQDTGATAASGSSPGNCVYVGAAGRFRDAQRFYSTPNTTDAATFAQDPETSSVRPALEACVRCDIGPAYHYYHVLLAR